MKWKILTVCLRKIDDRESYTRRQNLRVTGLAEPEDGNESSDGCLTKVKEEISKLNLPIELDVAIDRVHRIGKWMKDTEGKTISCAMIVRFTSWGVQKLLKEAKYVFTWA